MNNLGKALVVFLTAGFLTGAIKVKAADIDLVGLSTLKSGELELAVRTVAMEEDYDILCKVVESEAYGCTLRQKINVASTILNRTLAKTRWPNSVKGVLTQKGQFKVVENGFCNTVDISEDTKKAIEYIRVNGSVHNSEFFCTPKAAATNEMFKKMTPEFFDGAHNFYLYK